MADSDSLVIEAQASYEDAKNIADSALTAASDALAAASAAVGDLDLDWAVAPIISSDVDVSDSRLAVPGYIPTSDFSQDVKDAYDEKFAELDGTVQTQVQNYLDNFFPDIAEAIKTDSDDWIIDTILNGRGVPESVENALWNRARDREVKEAQRSEQSFIAAHASRGFSAPQGSLSALITGLQQDLAIKLSTINREIAIKAFDVINENTKFAIQQAVSLRTTFVSALGNFIQLASVQQNQPLDYAKTILAAKTSLHDAAVNLYTQKIQEERLRTTVDFGNLDQVIKNGNFFVDGRSKLTDAEIKIASVKSGTAISAAETLSRVASSALATRNTMLSVSAGVTS